MKKQVWIICAAVISAILVAGLARYGTLTPCGMFKSEVKRVLLSSMLEQDTGGTEDAWSRLGTGLGFVFARGILDSMVDAMTPWQCMKGMVRIHSGSSSELQAALPGYVSEPVSSPPVSASEASASPKSDREAEVAAAKANYMDKIELYAFEARTIDTYSDKDVPAVRFKLKNNGDRELRRVEVTVYFKDESGTVIAEEDFHPVSHLSIGGDNKPLRPNYIWEMERGKWYTVETVPTEWQVGSADAQITDIDFLEPDD